MPVGKEEDFDAKQDSATLQQKCCIGADTRFPPLHPLLLLLLLYFCLRVSLVLENPYFCNFCILLFDKSLKQADKQKKNSISPSPDSYYCVHWPGRNIKNNSDKSGVDSFKNLSAHRPASLPRREYNSGRGDRGPGGSAP